ARGPRGADPLRAAPDLEQHGTGAHRGRGRYAGRRSLRVDESSAHTVARAEQSALPGRAVRAVLSERLPGALQPVPHGRDTAADRRGRARARSSRAADAARHTRGLDRRIHVRCGRAARVRRGGYTVIVDVLIPTYGRPTALAVTLTSLCAQTMRPFRVVVSDQTDRARSIESAEVKAIARVLESHGCKVELLENLPRRGIAQQRQFLLDLATAP